MKVAFFSALLKKLKVNNDEPIDAALEVRVDIEITETNTALFGNLGVVFIKGRQTLPRCLKLLTQDLKILSIIACVGLTSR